ncbi:hypothetical protein CfE428DRAFT_2943 [Chthoniobacter flavus Ellin428]|uniref:Uncharacterized protein n=1 Tax=Chthoniobacter flavus Ellin428 TaxID=497964 RepID=B4D205_9BACT|nr:hypothetical protein CfE428DRAFT_2943 [Chthoniobacter flavus Ellin428]TCO93002.1 hypothetical protein EV701_105279 [Chthoniobacter flavus]
MTHWNSQNSLTENHRSSVSVRLETFQASETFCPYIEAPELDATKLEYCSYVENVVGAKSMTRSVTQDERFKLYSQSLHIDFLPYQCIAGQQIITQARVCHGSQFRCHTRLSAGPSSEDVLFKRIGQL